MWQGKESEKLRQKSLPVGRFESWKVGMLEARKAPDGLSRVGMATIVGSRLAALVKLATRTHVYKNEEETEVSTPAFSFTSVLRIRVWHVP